MGFIPILNVVLDSYGTYGGRTLTPPQPFPFPPPFPPVPLLPGNTEPNDSLLALASFGLVALRSSHGPVGALIGGKYPNRSEVVASVIGEDNVGVCTGSVNSSGKVLPEAPSDSIDGFTMETGFTCTGITGGTGEGTGTKDDVATFKGIVLAALGGVSPVSCEYRSFQYLISL